MIVAIHDDGYSEVKLAAFNPTGRILLQPWGRIEGKVLLGGSPVADERVVVGNDAYDYSDSGQRFALTSFYFETKTDSAGNFRFEKVPPGPCNVFRQTRISRTGFESHNTTVTVNPGGVTEVVLGGNGRAVIGKATANGAIGRIEWERVPVTLRLKTGYEPGPRPKRSDFASREAFIQASDHFFNSYGAQLPYGALCDANGSFCVQDVPPGQYKLQIIARGFNSDSVTPEKERSGVVPEIASFTTDITIPDIADGESIEPLNLGTIELKKP